MTLIGHDISFLTMTAAADLFGFDTVTLLGDPLARAKAALRVARHQVRLAYGASGSSRLETVLEDIEDDIGAHLVRIDDAVQDDADDAADTAEWWTQRQAELPLRAG
jgi:hypothetical protein